jgi:hypothetical protein
MLYNYFARRMGVMLTEAENYARSLRLALIENKSTTTGHGSAEETVESSKTREIEETVKELETVTVE